jgi:hypothetical protein
MNRSLLAILYLLISSLLLSPPPALAVDLYVQFFGNHPTAAVFAGSSLGWIISALLPNIIIMAGIFFFFLIIYGGFQLIVFGGQNNTPQRVAQSRNMITYGFIGFLLVVSAYFILQLISTVTGINFMNSPVT